MQALAQNGTIIFLETQLETVLTRLADAEDRPLLRDKTEFESLFVLRQPLYRQAADITVSTDHQSPSQVAETVLQALSKINMNSVCTV